MAEKHMQILTNLHKSSENVTDLSFSRATSSVSNRNEETPDVESAIKRLFPSTDRQHMPLFQTNPRRAKTAKVIMAVMLRKEYLIGGQYLILLRFNPNSVYRPKSANQGAFHVNRTPKLRRSKICTSLIKQKNY